MKRQIIIAALFLSTAAQAEMVLSGKPDNSYTQGDNQNYQSHMKMIDNTKIDKQSFSEHVQDVCDNQAPQRSSAEFERVMKEITGITLSLKDAGPKGDDYRKAMILSCYRGANWAVNGTDKAIKPQLLEQVKLREMSAKTTNDQANAAGFKIAVDTMIMGMDAAHK